MVKDRGLGDLLVKDHEGSYNERKSKKASSRLHKSLYFSVSSKITHINASVRKASMCRRKCPCDASGDTPHQFRSFRQFDVYDLLIKFNVPLLTELAAPIALKSRARPIY